MIKPDISRREALTGAAAMGGAMGMLLAAPAFSATRELAARLDLDNPRARARVLAKVKGSIAEEVVYTFCRLHLYLYLNDGNLKPLLSMQNLNATSWRPLPNGNYSGTVREVGVYTKFDTDEPVDSWLNPVTGDEREVWQFHGGPLAVEIGPEGIVTGPDATLKPREMRLDVLGDLLIAPNQSAFSFPNPLQADKWPKEAGGPVFFWDSHYFFAANLADVLNPRISSVPSAVQFQNMVSFHPWLGMGKTPGRTYGKGLGAKLRRLEDMPRAARTVIEKRAPEIFDLKSWTKPRIDFLEYMQQRKPT